MKYYKLIKGATYYPSFTPNKIYPEGFAPKNNLCDVGIYYRSNLNNGSWIEVPAGDYFVQEGIMPEYFAIKRVEDNTLWEKYIYWLNKKYLTNWSGNIDHCFYGFGKDKITHGACASMKNFGEDAVRLTLKQWDKIINKTMEEEFKLQKVWFIQLTEENKDIVRNWHKSVDKQNERRYNVGSFYGVHSDGSGDAWSCSSLPKNTQVITTEQFIKYVLNKEVIKENKEIIGWKLKEDCNQYEQAALNIVNQSKFYNFAEGYNFSTNSENESTFKKAGVLELWFKPIYKEEFKIGDWIYIICTGTGVTCPLTDTGKEHHGAKRCDVVKIEGITYKDGNANIKDPRYYGKNWNLRTESFRKATPEEIKAVQYPQITINGYKGEFFGNYVKFGCAEIDKDWFLQFYEIMRTVTYSNKEIESVTIGKGTFTKDQIKEIAQYYLNKK